MKGLRNRVRRLEGTADTSAFVMGFIVVADGALVGLAPIPTEERGDSYYLWVDIIRAWARRPSDGFVFLMTVDAEQGDPPPPIAPSEISEEAQRLIEPHLAVGGALHLT